MAHEGPGAQTANYYPGRPEGYPGPGLFNVGAMSNDQIVMLGRALDREDIRLTGKTQQLDPLNMTAGMIEHLGSDIAQMVTSDPERGRDFLSNLARSEVVNDRNLAAAAAVPLALNGEYEFARDVLLIAQQADRSQGDVGLADGRASDLVKLLRQTRPDQADDLERRSEELDPYE